VEFIYDHRATMNFCSNPSILRGHGALFYFGPRKSTISPFFVLSKLEQGGELLIPSVQGFSTRDGQNVIPWSERNSSKIFWRGRTTGNHFNRQHDWRTSHRIVLHNLTTSREGEENVLVEDEETGRPRLKAFNKAELNDAYMNVGLVGPPTQCSKDDGTCQAMAEGIDFLPLVKNMAGQDSKFALDVGEHISPMTTAHSFFFVDPFAFKTEMLGRSDIEDY
jgi:hypothetical protein